MTLDGWLETHRFLEPLARVRRRIDAAVDAVTTPLPAPPDWDEHAEDFASGVPLLQSQARIDLETAGHAVISVVGRLASDAGHAPLTQDASAQRLQFQDDPIAAQRVIGWLLGDDSWEPVRPGLVKSVGWLTLATALRPIEQAFAAWRGHDRWLARYCPMCGALPAMAQLIGIDPGRRRFMTCGRCASQWRYVRTGCPFCESDSHRLVSLEVHGEAGLRIDYCETCHGYLKTYSGQGDERVLLADWTSLHLDVVARERGLKRMATSLYDLAPEIPEAAPEFRTRSGGAESEPSAHPATLH